MYQTHQKIKENPYAPFKALFNKVIESAAVKSLVECILGIFVELLLN